MLDLLIGILVVVVIIFYPIVVPKSVQLLLGCFETGGGHELFVFCFGCSTGR